MNKRQQVDNGQAGLDALASVARTIESDQTISGILDQLKGLSPHALETVCRASNERLIEITGRSLIVRSEEDLVSAGFINRAKLQELLGLTDGAVRMAVLAGRINAEKSVEGTLWFSPKAVSEAISAKHGWRPGPKPSDGD